MDQVSLALVEAYRFLEGELQQTEVSRLIYDLDRMMARHPTYDHFNRGLRALQDKLRLQLRDEPVAVMMETLVELLKQRAVLTGTTVAIDLDLHLALQRWENEGGAICGYW